MTEQQRSLVEELRALQDARKREDPRITSIVSEVKLIRTEISGQAKCVNLSLGNSRAAVAQGDTNHDDIVALRDLVVVQDGQITGLLNELNSVKTDLQKALKRIDSMAQWAKTKGHEL